MTGVRAFGEYGDLERAVEPCRKRFGIALGYVFAYWDEYVIAVLLGVKPQSGGEQ